MSRREGRGARGSLTRCSASKGNLNTHNQGQLSMETKANSYRTEYQIRIRCGPAAVRCEFVLRRLSHSGVCKLASKRSRGYLIWLGPIPILTIDPTHYSSITHSSTMSGAGKSGGKGGRGKKAGGKSQSRSARAGLQFPVGRVSAPSHTHGMYRALIRTAAWIAGTTAAPLFPPLQACSQSLPSLLVSAPSAGVSLLAQGPLWCSRRRRCACVFERCAGVPRR